MSTFEFFPEDVASMLVEYWWWSIFFPQVFNLTFPVRNQSFSTESFRIAVGNSVVSQGEKIWQLEIHSIFYRRITM